MKVQNKLSIGLAIVMLIGFVCPMILRGMEEQEDELSMYFKQLPKELQLETRRLQLMRNAVMFLGFSQPLYTHKAHIKRIDSVAISSDKAATGSWDETAKIWDLRTGQLIRALRCNGYVTAVAIEGDIVVAGLSNGSIQIWNINNDQPLRIFKGHTGKGHTSGVKSVAISGETIVTGSEDETVKIWNINKDEPIRTIERSTQGVASVAMSNRIFIIGLQNGKAEVWNMHWDKPWHTLIVDTRQIYAVNDVAIGNNIVVTGSSDKTIKIWNLNKLEDKPLHLKGHTQSITSVAINGDRVASGSYDGTAKLWSTHSNMPLHTFKVHEDQVIKVALNDDMLVTGAEDGVVKMWDLKPFNKGTPQNNPLVWIVKEATIPQLILIKYAYEATVAGQEFIMDSKDLKLFLSLPKHAQKYLLERLNIKLKK
jgi:WD40 repeat protein